MNMWIEITHVSDPARWYHDRRGCEFQARAWGRHHYELVDYVELGGTARVYRLVDKTDARVVLADYAVERPTRTQQPPPPAPPRRRPKRRRRQTLHEQLEDSGRQRSLL